MKPKKLKIYFIGIGGIGVSALAQYYLEKGHRVSGSDLVSSEITNSFKKLGVKIFIGKHKKENLPPNVDLVVFSPAVQKDNPEFKASKKLQTTNSQLQILSYPEALGDLTKQYFTIAVSGTHGKSTTTAMIGLLLVKAGLDPSVIVGTKVKEFGPSTGGSNYRVGKSKYLVIESCEHEESFLNYSPDIIVITNIEPDHLDYYKNFKNYKKAFIKFTQKLKKNGIVITEKEYKNSKDAEKLKKILKVPGEHNVFNALAALAVARTLKIPDKISFKVLSEYRGSWRRFEITKILNPKPYTLINDYGHHPTEIKTTLKAAREKYPKKKIWCIFQPHQYHRTYRLFDDFVRAFRQAQDKFFIDKLIITDIYSVPGREKEYLKKKVSSQKLVKAIKKRNVIYLPTQASERSVVSKRDEVSLRKENILNYLKDNLQGGEVVIIMGAGDIYEMSRQFRNVIARAK